MKDKLTKNGHKKPYYRFVGAVKGLGLSLLAIIALASPVVIAMGVSAYEAEARAEEHPSLTVQESEDSSENA